MVQPIDTVTCWWRAGVVLIPKAAADTAELIPAHVGAKVETVATGVIQEFGVARPPGTREEGVHVGAGPTRVAPEPSYGSLVPREARGAL